MQNQSCHHDSCNPQPPVTSEPAVPAVSPDSTPLMSVRTLVLLNLAAATAILAAVHPSLMLPIGAGATALTLLHKITSN